MATNHTGRSIDPNNVTSLNAHNNFVSNTGAFELVLVVDAKVSTIGCCLGLLAAVATKTVGPFEPEPRDKQRKNTKGKELQ